LIVAPPPARKQDQHPTTVARPLADHSAPHPAYLPSGNWAIGLALLGLAAAVQVGYQGWVAGHAAISRRYLVEVILLTVLGVGLLLAPRRGSGRRAAERLTAFMRRQRWLAWMTLAALPLALPGLLMGPLGRHFPEVLVRLLLAVALALVAAPALQAVHSGLDRRTGFLAAALLIGLGYRLALFIPELSTYPFTLTWSEASRYYYASLFFAPDLYGVRVPLSPLHPSRYLMQSLAFLFTDSAIWFHRAWQVGLWLAASSLTGLLLARRIGLASRRMVLAFIAWVVVYLLMAPVYYHLLVPVILVLWGARPSRPGLTLGVVLLASAWCGISRVNWIPVPGMLATALYLLEQPGAGKGTWRSVVWPGFCLALGAMAGLAAQVAYVRLSGNSLDRFTSSFTSDLLWYRLLPNSTFDLGVLPAALLACLPLLVLVFPSVLAGRKHSQTGPGWLILSALCLTLFAGGLLVSVKIGGGSNLHNLDAFLVLILVIGSYLFFRPAGWLATPAIGGGSLAAVLIPLFFTIRLGGPWTPPNIEQGRADLARLKELLAQVGDGEILLISERHLLTFGQISGVGLVPEYETVFLMEMAMAGNRDYLGRFHSDLREGRFDLIVVKNLEQVVKGRDFEFGEENDAWVREVSVPILCEYRPIASIEGASLQLLSPRDEEVSCDFGTAD
jgi:hypothetical protein